MYRENAGGLSGGTRECAGAACCAPVSRRRDPCRNAGRGAAGSSIGSRSRSHFRTPSRSGQARVVEAQERGRCRRGAQIKAPEKAAARTAADHHLDQEAAADALCQRPSRSRIRRSRPACPAIRHRQGVFSVIEKQIYHESNLYSSAPMPYMQRITWSGVAMHQGVVPGHPASHGCIRLPARVRTAPVGHHQGRRARDHRAGRCRARRYRQHAPVRREGPQRQRRGAAPAAKIRFATSAVSDAPLKGSIDASTPRKRASRARSTRWCRPAWLEADERRASDARSRAPFDKAARRAPRRTRCCGPARSRSIISRKLGKLSCARASPQVFEAPVTIAQPDEPLGTHVFTALEAKDDGTMRWNVASLPTERVVKQGKYLMTIRRAARSCACSSPRRSMKLQPPGDPNAALERITIPAGRARAHQRADDAGRVADRLRPRHRASRPATAPTSSCSRARLFRSRRSRHPQAADQLLSGGTLLSDVESRLVRYKRW